jgi:hypothetical protein
MNEPCWYQLGGEPVRYETHEVAGSTWVVPIYPEVTLTDEEQRAVESLTADRSIGEVKGGS